MPMLMFRNSRYSKVVVSLICSVPWNRTVVVTIGCEHCWWSQTKIREMFFWSTGDSQQIRGTPAKFGKARMHNIVCIIEMTS